MPTAFTVLPVILVVVFAASGASKLGRRDLVTTTLQNFRLPAPMQHPIVVALLPAVELLLGLGVFAARGWVFTAIAACAVLVTGVFVVIVGQALSRGDRFDCGCFGSTIRTPISGALLLRNVLLFAAAIGSVVLGVTGFDGVVPEIATFTTDDVAWLSISVLLAVLTLTMFGTPHTKDPAAADTAPASRGDHTLTSGDRIPDMHLDTLSGSSSRILDSIADRPHLVIFAKAGCRSCHTLLQQGPALTRELGTDTGMLLLVMGDAEAFEGEHPRLAPYALYGAGALAARLGVNTYPAAVLLSSDGTLLSDTVRGAVAIHDLAIATSSQSTSADAASA